MPRGGHRENAGRKRGTPNKASAARQAEVAASGVTPLEVMLDNMLHLMGEIARQRQIAQKCAADSANYVHPKRANIQHGSHPENPLNAVTDADRAQVILA